MGKQKKIISLAKIVLLNQVLLFLLSITEKSSAEAKKIKVVSPICTFADIAKNIGGDRVDVINLSDGLNDPHFVEPRPSMIIHMRNAEVVIPIGLRLDLWFFSLIEKSANPKIFEGSSGFIRTYEGVRILEVPEYKFGQPRIGDIHPEGNPHYWLPPDNAKAIAMNIAKKLSELYPEDKEFFIKNTEIFTKKIDEAVEDLKREFSRFEGVKAVQYHKTFTYFADFFKIKIVGEMEPYPGIPPTPSHISQLAEKMKKEGVELIIYEPFRNKKDVEKLSKITSAIPTQIYADCVPQINELKDYISLIRYNIRKIILNIEERENNKKEK
ncbi:Manganese ABC transporter substrate-binding lipoprotein [bacterium HR19]|nr:Manganese ABC transporter substrate-binding lipoprotein [bacterium HR19]